MLIAAPAAASDSVGVRAKGGQPEYLFLEKVPRAEAKVTAEKLAQAIRTVLGDPGMKERAEVLRGSMQQEDGVTKAAELIERHLVS